MIATSSLWIVFTLVAALAQTARNTMQRELTATLGTVGATHVRFLFGFPFALVFLAIVLAATGGHLPRPGLEFWPWLLAGALTQILATALMLAAMGERSFVVTIAYVKTEPVQVALFGFIFLGDVLTAPALGAIVLATAGVIVTAFKRGDVSLASGRATAMGLAAAASFALSAVAFRGAILSVPDVSFVMAATYALACGLFVQTALLTAWLWLRDPKTLATIMRAWRPSLFAGFMGALGSQFWFLAFALAAAANVRTLALVEVLFAHAVTRFWFRQPSTSREIIGIVLIVVGVAALILGR